MRFLVVAWWLLAQEADVVEEDASIPGEEMGKMRKRVNKHF